MGRKSVKTAEQWIEIERRHFIDGVSVNALAKELGIDESTIRKKINPNKSEQEKYGKSLKTLALQKSAAERLVKKAHAEISILPISRQEIVSDLSRKYRNISDNISSAAEMAAATAHRLTAIANQQLINIDDADPFKTQEGQDGLRAVAALTTMANEASKIPLNLIAANKDEAARALEGESQKPMTLDEFYR